MTRLPTGRASAGNEWTDYPRKLIDLPSLRRVLTLVQRCMTLVISNTLCFAGYPPNLMTELPSLRLVFTLVQRRMMVRMFDTPG